MIKNLLRSLKNDVRWKVAFKTFGSSHSTLIGLLVDWWITNDPINRSALDEGYTFDRPSKSKGSKGAVRCDAVLFEKQISKGIVEVEGTSHRKTIKKIGQFFKAKGDKCKTLEFGIFFAYPAYPAKPEFQFEYAKDKLIDQGKKMTSKCLGKQLVMLFLEKKYGGIFQDFPSLSQYYKGDPTKVTGILLRNGKIIDSCNFKR